MYISLYNFTKLNTGKKKKKKFFLMTSYFNSLVTFYIVDGPQH